MATKNAMTLKEIKSNEEFNNGSKASICVLAMDACQMDPVEWTPILCYLSRWQNG